MNLIHNQYNVKNKNKNLSILVGILYISANKDIEGYLLRERGKNNYECF